MFNVFDDDVKNLSIDYILEYVSEKDVFQLVFGFQPEENIYVTSPFRQDNNPGCWFNYSPNGVLKFTDYGNKTIINNVRMENINCFDAVRIYYKLPSFYDTLLYIKLHLIDSNPIKTKRPITHRNTIKKSEIDIRIIPKNFTKKDLKFWKSYKIFENQLKKDKVFSVDKYIMYNTKKGDLIFSPKDLCFAYTDFNNRRKKLYFPHRKKKDRFITNCKENDLGNIKNIPKSGKYLIITKSYKDCKVIVNNGYLNTIWTQSESQFPSEKKLYILAKNFEDIYIIFDNDEAGILGTESLIELFNKIGKKITPLFLDKSKDCSDLVSDYGNWHLQQFLKQFINI